MTKKEDLYTVYVLESESSKRYIGMTSDLEHRLNKHNSGLSTYTKREKNWSLIWNSKSMSIGDAKRLENLMKNQKGGSGLIKIMKDYNGS